MVKYNIPLRIKISKKEYDKLKNRKNKSKFVRDAINSYTGRLELEKEYSKKKIIKTIKKELYGEVEKYKKQKLLGEETISRLEDMDEECSLKLEKIEKEQKRMEFLNSIAVDEKTTEERILDHLPTIQGIYNSEIGITYDSLRTVAQKIGISTMELIKWVESNMNLVEENDYKFRPRGRAVANGKVYKDFNRTF